MQLKMSLKIAAAAVWCLVVPVFAGPDYCRITILHTNDTHGHLIPFSYPDPPKPDVVGTSWPSTYRDIGGIARRATLIHRIEQEMKSNVVVIDAGDQLDGTPFSVEYMGEADEAAMAAAGYDLKTFGNHEFSANLTEFNRNLKVAGFPTLCANMVDKKAGVLYTPECVVKNFDGAKVAFFGLVVPAPNYTAAKEGFEFLDPIEIARKLVPELRKQADIVVAITHIGEDMDRKLASEVPGIDVIVGGHSHTRLPQGEFVRTSEKEAFKVGGTVIVQAGQWGQELGELNLYLRSDGQHPYTLMLYDEKLIPVTSDVPEDPATAKVLNRYLQPIWKQYGEVIGEAQSSFYAYADENRHDESTMMNLVCDALRDTFKADVAMFNSGGIRGDLARGPVRMWDIATVLPFRNNTMSLQIDGKRLKKALAELRPGVSGVRYAVDADGKLLEATIDGKPVDDSATYKVVTNDWFASFGFKDIQATDTKVTCRDAVKQYIKAKKTIAPVADGRRVTSGPMPPA